MHRLFQDRRLLLLPSLLMLALACGVCVFWDWSPSRKQVGLRFLAYTNNGFAQVTLFEITNHSADAVIWSLHADGRPLDYRVAVTELIETNGEMRHIGSGGPLTLFGHDSLQFGTDELKPTENKVWVNIRRYPMTWTGRYRERLCGWLNLTKRGTRVDGPVLP